MKKALHILLVAALQVLLLSACSSGGNGGDTPSTAKGTGNSTTANKPGTQESAKKVELRVMLGQPRFKEQFEKYFDQFKAKELAEKNIDVTIELEMPNPEQAKQVLQSRLASNDAPDIFDVHANDLATYNKAGYLEDLSSQPFVSKRLGSRS